MAGVLVDTCGWIAFVKSGMNLDSAMSNVIGKPDLIVIDSVWKELDDLSRGKRGLLLGLLKSRSEMMDNPPREGHTEMMLVRLSKMNNWPVLTDETRFKEKQAQ